MTGTLPSAFDPNAVAAWCGEHCDQLADFEAELKRQAECAATLALDRDAATAERDAVNAQVRDLHEQVTAKKLSFNGPEADKTFRAIVSASTFEDRMAQANARATESQCINVLSGSGEFGFKRLIPDLTMSAYRAEVALLQAIARMNILAACVAGIRRHVAANELAKTDGIVSFPSSGGRVNELLDIARTASSRYGSARTQLDLMEARNKENM